MIKRIVPQQRRSRGIALGVVVIFALSGAGCGGGGGSSTTAAAPKPATPVAATENQLKVFAASLGHPVFWAGPLKSTYELTSIADGRTYIRYLPPGTPVGSPSALLTIGTYIRPVEPYPIVRAAAQQKRATIRLLPHRTVAIVYPARPNSVFLVFPGKLYEVEVYDPVAAVALQIATSGQVVPLA